MRPVHFLGPAPLLLLSLPHVLSFLNTFFWVIIACSAKPLERIDYFWDGVYLYLPPVNSFHCELFRLKYAVKEKTK